MNKFGFDIPMSKGYVMMIFVDKFIVDNWPNLKEDNKKYLDENYQNKLLDARFFNEEKEFRVFRFDLSETEFKIRELKVNDGDGFISKQYIDLDASRSSGNKCYTTNGGSYTLPFEPGENEMMKIWNKVEYDENGHAYIDDWCLCGFEKEENK